SNDVREGGRGLPDWRTLTKHMIVYLEDNAFATAQLDRLKNAFDKGRYQRVAEVFAKSAGAHFANFLSSELDPGDIRSSPIHEIILKTGFRRIFTTNLDRVFEHQSVRSEPLPTY